MLAYCVQYLYDNDPGDVMLGDTMNASVCAVFACGGVMDDGGDGGDGGDG